VLTPRLPEHKLERPDVLRVEELRGLSSRGRSPAREAACMGQVAQVRICDVEVAGGEVGAAPGPATGADRRAVASRAGEDSVAAEAPIIDFRVSQCAG